MPIHKQITLRCSRAHAFRTWVERIDLWWPSGHRSMAGSTMRMDGVEGGQLVEEGVEGQRFVFGQVLRWDPPSGMTLAWYPGTGLEHPTEVEVRFIEVGEAQTRVEVEHREAAPLEDGVWPKRAVLYTRAWTHVLDALETFLN